MKCKTKNCDNEANDSTAPYCLKCFGEMEAYADWYERRKRRREKRRELLGRIGDAFTIVFR